MQKWTVIDHPCVRLASSVGTVSKRKPEDCKFCSTESFYLWTEWPTKTYKKKKTTNREISSYFSIIQKTEECVKIFAFTEFKNR